MCRPNYFIIIEYKIFYLGLNIYLSNTITHYFDESYSNGTHLILIKVQNIIFLHILFQYLSI